MCVWTTPQFVSGSTQNEIVKIYKTKMSRKFVMNMFALIFIIILVCVLVFLFCFPFQDKVSNDLTVLFF